MKKYHKIILGVIAIPVAVLAVITITYYGFLFVAHDFSPDFLEIDSCLDLGGAWNYETNVCGKG